MRVFEITGDLPIYINAEEEDFLIKYEEPKRSELNEREIEIANMLVRKAILIRKKKKGNLYYVKNQ